jgi:hypothetical protein
LKFLLFSSEVSQFVLKLLGPKRLESKERPFIGKGQPTADFKDEKF